MRTCVRVWVAILGNNEILAVVREIVKTIAGFLLFSVLMAAAMSPLFTMFSWYNGSEIRAVQADGVETIATVNAAKSKYSTRTGTTYYLDLSWRDRDGAIQEASNIDIWGDRAENIVSNNELKTQNVRIKYLPSESSRLLVLDDYANDEALQNRTMRFGLGIWILSWIFAIPVYRLLRST